MKITNIHNLPQPLYDAIVNDEYHKSGTFSASELPRPAQMRVLVKRHYDEIVKDASEFLWLIQGKSIHKLLEHGRDANDLREEELVWDIGNGITISGSTDLYTGSVVDWKVTSVWSFINGGLKPEWEKQLNVYGWLWRRHGFSTSALWIYAILRDWQKSRRNDAGYPAIPFQKVEVPGWPDEAVEKYISDRVAIHLAAEKLPDDALPECSKEDMWEKDEVWALMKKGRKSAVKLYSSEKEAQEKAADATGHYVQHRPGRRVRCEEYCDAKEFCHQYQRQKFQEQFPGEEEK